MGMMRDDNLYLHQLGNKYQKEMRNNISMMEIFFNFCFSCLVTIWAKYLGILNEEKMVRFCLKISKKLKRILSKKRYYYFSFIVGNYLLADEGKCMLFSLINCKTFLGLNKKLKIF